MTKHNDIEKVVEEFISRMRRMKTSDVPLWDATEQRAYNQGWDCATDYAAEKMKKALTTLTDKVREEEREAIRQALIYENERLDQDV